MKPQALRTHRQRDALAANPPTHRKREEGRDHGYENSNRELMGVALPVEVLFQIHMDSSRRAQKHICADVCTYHA